jgi:transcriptional regulator with XRE-family HTH domain
MRIRSSKDLGVYLRARRTQLGMAQATLAEKAGTSRKWLIEVESGKPGAALSLVMRTLRALDVAVNLSADVPASQPAKFLKRKSGKAAASKPAKRSRRLPGRHNLAELPVGEIDEVLRALKKAATRR